jgi:universal stress protein A
MAMFQRILVPVDLTQKNARAVETARDLASESGGTVTLLHVIETLDLPFDELEGFYARLEQKARRAMDEMAAPLQEAGLSFARRVSYGKRAEEIVDFAAEEDSDLIILSSHRIDLENPGSSWTTLSYKVAILAQCPVLLVK